MDFRVQIKFSPSMLKYLTTNCRTFNIPSSAPQHTHSSTAGYLDLATTDILVQIILYWGGDVQYTIFSTYLVSTHEMPGVPSSSCDKQKCLQTLPNVPERENHTEHYRSKLGLLLKAIPSHQAIFLYFCSYEPPVLEVTSPTLLLTYDPSSKTTSTSKKTT